MMTPRFTPTLLAAALAATFSAATQAADADTETRFKALEARLAALETENQMLKSQQKTTEQKVAAVSEEVQTSAAATSWVANTSIGGYGELHYNNLNGKGGAPDKKEIDFNRFVLFFGHKFDERTRFFSEVELEHVVASNVDKGEVELEQAYLEFDLNENHRAKAGLFLIPVGILNETHEPPTFYGVERNPVERDIIPATWWAGGVGLSGNFGAGFGYDFAIHEGLATSQVDGYKPSEGRQETSEASAKDPAYTARLKWTGLPGLRLAAAFQHQKNITQGTDATAGSANLYEVDGVYSQGPFMLKTLYAQWNLDGKGPAAIGADKQFGWYIEPAFKLNESWGFFARHNVWDNKAGDSVGSKMRQTNLGVNFWPHPDVVLKADYQWQDNDDDKNQNGFNFGVGYQF